MLRKEDCLNCEFYDRKEQLCSKMLPRYIHQPWLFLTICPFKMPIQVRDFFEQIVGYACEDIKKDEYGWIKLSKKGGGKNGAGGNVEGN